MPATSVADKSVRLLQLSLVVADDFMVVARCAADVATVDRTRFAALHIQMTVVGFSRVHVHFV